jgi:hypothetical protein
MIKRIIISILVIILSSCFIYAQEESTEKVKPRPVRSTFESIWMMDNQTVEVPFKKTLEWDIQHRFGTWNNGYEDYYGLAAPSNIRLGFIYVPIENLQIGWGITKERKLWDFSAKYVLIKQKQNAGFPITIAYYLNTGIDSRDAVQFTEASDRFSYFNQLMFARRFSDKLSIQIAPSFSYYNMPESVFDVEGNFQGFMNNTHFAIAGMGRFKITESMGLIVNFDLPITDHQFNNPEKNIAIGLEFTTSSHAFQVFVGNYQSLNPQYNNLLNQNRFGDNQILVGFNITRLWNF